MKDELQSTYEDPVLIAKAIQSMVIIYKKQFENDSKNQKYLSDLAAMELLKLFHPLKGMFFKAIKDTVYSYRNVCFRIFMSCCIEDKSIKQRYSKNSITIQDHDHIYVKLKQIKEAYHDNEDMYNDFDMILLILAKRYKPVEGKTFRMYVEQAFPYELYRHIKRHFIDEISCWKSRQVDLDEDLEMSPRITYPLVTGYHDMAEEIFEKGITDSKGFLNESWIAGKDCSELFSKFTETHRRATVMYFLRNYPDRMIAEMNNVHTNTINKYRNRVVGSLKKKLNIEAERPRQSGKSMVV